MEELKKEWEKSFDEMFGQFQYPGITSPSWNEIDMKRFISSLLAKQQADFVKCIPEEKPLLEEDREEEATTNELIMAYNECIADIKSKLKI
jgi:hypothetical protein